jgi:hypothetical protein
MPDVLQSVLRMRRFAHIRFAALHCKVHHQIFGVWTSVSLASSVLARPCMMKQLFEEPAFTHQGIAMHLKSSRTLAE